MQPSSGIVELLKATEKGLALKGQGFSCSYNSQAKSYVISLEAHSSKLTLPAQEKSLSLPSPFINFQIFIVPNKPFAVELAVMDISNTKRRLVFSSAVKSTTVSHLHARILNDQFPRNTWANVCIDIVAFLGRCFPAATFRSLEEITLFSFCRIKRVFASRLPLAEGLEGLNCLVPKSYEFNHGVEVQTAVIRPQCDPPHSQKPPISAIKLRPPTLTLENMRNLRTASPNIQKRMTSSTSPGPRPQKSAPPHRILPFKQSKTPTKTTIRSNFSSLSPQKVPTTGKSPVKKRTGNHSISPSTERGERGEKGDNKDMYTTAYSKFDSAATNLGDEVASVQEEIEEELKAADKSLARLREIPTEPGDLGVKREEGKKESGRKLSYLEAELDQVTNMRPYSPPFAGVIAGESIKMKAKESQETEVELIHDPVLHCYYNPKTQEFFEIDN